MRGVVRGIVLLVGLGLGAVQPVSGQSRVPTALAGTIAGAGAGGYVGLSIIVARSRAGHYMHSYSDALGWGSVPVIGGAITGGVIGFSSPDRLWRTVLMGSAGTVAGLGAGIVAGQLAWHGPDAKWAGGAIGAGAGMAIGSLLGVWLPMKKDETVPPQARVGVPVAFTVRF